MGVDGSFFGFSDSLRPVEQAHSETLSVADSWLVVDGSAVAAGRHFQRFRDSIVDDETTRAQLADFERAVRQAVSVAGQWFPRIEYRAECEPGHRLFLRMRPAPELTEYASLWTFLDLDPRVNPLIKGPDLSVCQQLRRAANLHGADEAVLLDAEGFIAEGALSAVVWWRGETLCAPDDSTPWLPSITRELVVEMAQQAGYPVVFERAKPAQLAGCEVWSLSSLQGVRGVNAWSGVDILPPVLFTAFRKRLKLMAEAVV
jgi:branched-subunit amino acid aminotransferase/4-amino-4-deoxychorismate lyase